MTIAQRRQCSGCQGSFVGLEFENLCPTCGSDQEIYRATRRRGEPRQFLPYPQLLEEWRKRRAECKAWRKTNEAAQAALGTARRLEEANAVLRLAVEQSAVDLAAEVRRLRRDLETERLRADYWQQRAPDWQTLFAGVTASTIPPDRLKRLKALCHPDRWQGQPQERTATELMQWLNSLEIR